MAPRFVRVEQLLGLSAGLFLADDSDVWGAVGRGIDTEVPEGQDLGFKRD